MHTSRRRHRRHRTWPPREPSSPTTPFRLAVPPPREHARRERRRRIIRDALLYATAALGIAFLIAFFVALSL